MIFRIVTKSIVYFYTFAQIKFSVSMKKFMLFMMLGISTIVWGQTVDNVTKIRLQPGENTSWRPYESCKELRFSTSGSNVIKTMPKADGRVMITAVGCGTATITAKCGEESMKAKVIVAEIKPEDTMKFSFERPVAKPFTGTYKFNPPTDHYFISYTDPMGKSTETRVKIGDEESYHDDKGVDCYWNVKTGENFHYDLDKGWQPDVKFDFEPLASEFFPLNAFNIEVPADSIANCYLGEEEYLGINCWVFFTQKPDGSIVKFWVDPANGCTLKRQVNSDEPCVVKMYTLNYTKWEFGPRKKSRKDITR